MQNIQGTEPEIALRGKTGKICLHSNPAFPPRSSRQHIRVFKKKKKKTVWTERVWLSQGHPANFMAKGFTSCDTVSSKNGAPSSLCILISRRVGVWFWLGSHKAIEGGLKSALTWTYFTNSNGPGELLFANGEAYRSSCEFLYICHNEANRGSLGHFGLGNLRGIRKLEIISSELSPSPMHTPGN